MNNNFYGIERKTEETDFEFCLRCCLAKQNKELDCEWADLVEAFPLLNNCHYDTLRKNFVGKMGVGEVVKFYEDKIAHLATQYEPDELQQEFMLQLEQKQQELKKERFKLNDERGRLNSLLRTEARWEMVVDYLKKTVESYQYKPTDYIVYKKYEGGETEASLLLSDWHIGTEFHTFHNTYGLDVAKSRANRLKDDVIDYCELHKVKTLYIEILGDMTSGNIHLTTRLSNSENVIEQVVETSELLAKFIHEVSLVVPNIKLVYCVGNHGRVNASVKESLAEENFEYLIRWHLETKLQYLENVEWIYNTIDKEVAYYELECGRNIASCHGHREKNYKEAVKNLTHYFGVCKVDEVHMGHFHNHQVINNVIVNGSFMGTDEYAGSLRFNDIPSQTLRIYDTKGNFITYQINLN